MDRNELREVFSYLALAIDQKIAGIENSISDLAIGFGANPDHLDEIMPLINWNLFREKLDAIRKASVEVPGNPMGGKSR